MARESAPGPGAGGGWAARDRSGGSALAPSALPGSGPPVARRGRAGRGSGCLWRERRLVVRPGDLRSFPPVGVAWDGYPGGLGGAEYGALPTFLQVVRRRLGGSSRRRAQSPFVRRNKERHCVFLYGGDTHRRAWVLPGTGVVVPGVQEGEVAHPFRRNGAFASVKTGGGGSGMVVCLILPHIPRISWIHGFAIACSVVMSTVSHLLCRCCWPQSLFGASDCPPELEIVKHILMLLGLQRISALTSWRSS